MDIRWLQDFLSLAEAGSFTVAADARHSSQPALSRRIQALEAWLGVELIDRSRYPTSLTPSGKLFRAHAAELIKKVIDSRAELQGEPTHENEQITFALPHALAISRFPHWWKDWQEETHRPSCRLLATNVHDAVTTFVAGRADILICFHHAQQPIFLDPERYERVSLGIEWLRPYSAARRGQPIFKLPGASRLPVPLLNYSSGAFLGRMVDLIRQSAPEDLHAIPAFESDLADALLGMAVNGHGVAWLPEGTAEKAVHDGKLRLAGDERWALPITVFAYRDLAHARPSVVKMMKSLEHRALKQVSQQERSGLHLVSSGRQQQTGDTAS
jgi:LysR family transcriptional regulator, hypochlorite-specific transcription factor HypT